MYIYGDIISEEMLVQAKENPELFNSNFEYMKQNIGILDDFEILDKFGITEQTLIEGKAYKEKCKQLNLY